MIGWALVRDLKLIKIIIYDFVRWVYLFHRRVRVRYTSGIPHPDLLDVPRPSFFLFQGSLKAVGGGLFERSLSASAARAASSGAAMLNRFVMSW